MIPDNYFVGDYYFSFVHEVVPGSFPVAIRFTIRQWVTNRPPNSPYLICVFNIKPKTKP